MKNYRAIIFLLLIFSLSNNSETFAKEKEIFKDVNAYKAKSDIGITEEKKIDINNDGQEDFLIFTTGGEETFLDILLSEKDHYVLLEVPTAEKYEIVKYKNTNHIKTESGTFPQYGNPIGPDKYPWYDYYEVQGKNLILQNNKHPEIFEKMIPLYKSRILEIDKEILSLQKQKKSKGSEPGVLDFYISNKYEQINQYKKFIEKAEKITKGKNI
jgi:hypothetical protein